MKIKINLMENITQVNLKKTNTKESRKVELIFEDLDK